MTFWRAGAGGVSIEVKVQPHARKPGLLGRVPGIEGERLRVAVAEPPEDGRANEAVCRAMADALGVSRAAVAVTAGATSRQKRLRIDGDPVQLIKRLEVL
jgi:uncharacterized protein (TIGR00251 family)